jgi:membrane protein
MATDLSRGQRATRPREFPARGWKDILQRVMSETSDDHVSVVSAGVAFFGLLAIFPAVGAVISIASFFLDPSDIAAQMKSVASLLPQNAASIIQDQVVQVTGGSQAATGFAAITGIALAFYGASKGMMTLMEGMNIAYDEEETRGIAARYLTGFALTLFLILGFLIAFGAMIVLPAVVAFLKLPGGIGTVISWAKWPILALLTIFGLAVVYRFGPSRARPKWRWVTPGSVIATLLWLAGTVAFSIYARNFGSYNETYGTLGGVIILLTWLWLSSFIVLLGAELNSEMEHQTQRDTTTGAARPFGQRGAVMADTMPEGLDAPVAEDGRSRTPGRRSGVSGVAGDQRHRGAAALIIGALTAWGVMKGRRGQPGPRG